MSAGRWVSRSPWVRGRMLLCLGLAVAIWSLAGTAVARVGPPSSCHPKGSRILGQGHLAVVFEDSNGRFWLCQKSRRRNHRLPALSTVGEHSVDPTIRFASAYVAIDDAQPSTSGDADETIYVFQISTGRLTMKSTTPESVGSLVLSRRGSTAWITSNFVRVDPAGHPIPPQVIVHDKAGQRVIDQGAGIRLGSLTLTGGTTLNWVHSGKPRTASLN